MDLPRALSPKEPCVIVAHHTATRHRRMIGYVRVSTRECFDKLFIDFGIDHLKVDNIVSKVPTEQLKTILDRVEEDLKKKKIPLADLKAQEYLLGRLDERS